MKGCSPSQRVAIGMHFNVVECYTLNGQCIRFEVQSMLDEHPPLTEPSQRGAFTVMIVAAREVKLPSKILTTPERYEIGRGDHRLHDDVIDFIKKRVYPHKNAEAKVCLQLLGGDGIPLLKFIFTHYFFCV